METQAEYNAGNKQVEKAKDAIAKRAPVRSLREWVTDPVMKQQFAMALPKFFTPERFVRIALTQLTKTPKLLNCSQASVMSCLLSCAELGIEPDGRKAHLIPYKDQCTLIIDYKGLVALARRSGEILDIHADVVGKNDSFSYAFGSDGHLRHKPCLEDRGEIIAAYSYVKLKDGSESFDVMSVAEIEAIRKRSRAGTAGPWVTDWQEMAKKTVFRRHAKWLPMEAEYQEAIDKDDDRPVDITPPIPAPIPMPAGPEIVDPGANAEAIPDQNPANPLSDEEKAQIRAAENVLEKKRKAAREPGAEG